MQQERGRRGRSFCLLPPVWPKCSLSFFLVFFLQWITTKGQTHRFISWYYSSLSMWPWARHRNLKLPWLRASAKCLKCKITVLPPLMSLGYSGVWRRLMTQTVWGDDICPVRTDRERERESEPSFWKQRRKILCYGRTERERESWEERLMGRVKGKQLQHRDSLFWSAAKGRSPLPFLIGNFLCLPRTVSHVADFDGVVCRGIG